MKALLKTRCGCTRMIDILYPVINIRIPLIVEPKVAPEFLPPTNAELPIREFRLSDKVYLFDGSEFPLYLEVS